MKLECSRVEFAVGVGRVGGRTTANAPQRSRYGKIGLTDLYLRRQVKVKNADEY
jgi:hypothetical protein